MSIAEERKIRERFMYGDTYAGKTIGGKIMVKRMGTWGFRAVAMLVAVLFFIQPLDLWSMSAERSIPASRVDYSGILIYDPTASNYINSSLPPRMGILITNPTSINGSVFLPVYMPQNSPHRAVNGTFTLIDNGNGTFTYVSESISPVITVDAENFSANPHAYDWQNVQVSFLSVGIAIENHTFGFSIGWSKPLGYVTFDTNPTFFNNISLMGVMIPRINFDAYQQFKIFLGDDFAQYFCAMKSLSLPGADINATFLIAENATLDTKLLTGDVIDVFTPQDVSRASSNLVGSQLDNGTGGVGYLQRLLSYVNEEIIVMADINNTISNLSFQIILAPLNLSAEKLTGVVGLEVSPVNVEYIKSYLNIRFPATSTITVVPAITWQKEPTFNSTYTHTDVPGLWDMNGVSVSVDAFSIGTNLTTVAKQIHADMNNKTGVSFLDTKKFTPVRDPGFAVLIDQNFTNALTTANISRMFAIALIPNFDLDGETFLFRSMKGVVYDLGRFINSTTIHLPLLVVDSYGNGTFYAVNVSLPELYANPASYIGDNLTTPICTEGNITGTSLKTAANYLHYAVPTLGIFTKSPIDIGLYVLGDHVPSNNTPVRLAVTTVRMPTAPTYVGKHVQVTGYFVNTTKGREMLWELLNISDQNNGTGLLRGVIEKLGDVLRYILNETGLIHGVLYAIKIELLPDLLENNTAMTISRIYVPNTVPTSHVNVSIDIRNNGYWHFVDLLVVYIVSPNGTIQYNWKLLGHLLPYWYDSYNIPIDNLSAEEGNYSVHAFVIAPFRDFAEAVAYATCTFEMDSRFAPPQPISVYNGTHLADWVEEHESKYYTATLSTGYLLTVTVKPRGGDVDVYLYYNDGGQWIQYDSSTRVDEKIEVVSMKAWASLSVLIDVYGYTTSGYSMYVDITDFGTDMETTFQGWYNSANPYITPRADGFEVVYEYLPGILDNEQVGYRNFDMNFQYSQYYSIYTASSSTSINGVGFTRNLASGSAIYVYGIDNWTSWYQEYDSAGNLTSTGQFSRAGDYPSIAYDAQTNQYYLAYRTPEYQINLSRYDASWNFIDDRRISWDENQSYMQPDIRIVGNDIYVVYDSYNATTNHYIGISVINITSLQVKNYYFDLNCSMPTDPSIWFTQNNFFLGFVYEHKVFIARYDENWEPLGMWCIPVTDELLLSQYYQYSILLNNSLISVYDPGGYLRIRHTYFPIHEFTDNVPPTITHTPPSSVALGEYVTLSFTITDNTGVQKAYIYYKLPGSFDYTEENLYNFFGGNVWETTLPQITDYGTLEYYVVVVDQDGNIAQTQVYTVDVNGTISTYFPIRINGDTDFTFANGVFSGSGTKENPYIIEGLTIDAKGYGYGIYIGNTTAYFVVRNNHIYNASGVDWWPYYYDSGIILYNVTNGIVENNTVSNCSRDGISLFSSNSVLVKNNDVTNTLNWGIEIYSSHLNTITENYLSGNAWAGIRVCASTNNLITNNYCSGNSDGIYLLSSFNNTIMNNTCSDNSDTGILLYYSSNNTIINNNCSGNSYYGIYLYYYSGNNTITNNTCSGNSDTGILLYSAGDNTITNNNCSGNSYSGMWLYNASSNNTIQNNTCSWNSGYGLFLYSSPQNTITNNNCSGNSYYGIWLYSSNNNRITSNKLWNDGIGIYGELLEHWNTHIIENNTVNGKVVYYYKNQTGGTVPSDAGQVILANCTNMVVSGLNISNASVGISLGFSTHSTITHTVCSNNSLYGIFLSTSHNNTITNNNCSGNSRYGIALYWYSNNNTITNNNCSGNSWYGIRVYYSSNNTIAYNSITDNTGYGVYITNSSTGNCIQHNNFINNNAGGKQGYDSVGGNYWDDSTAGNYWSDWTTPDNNGDGIVDIPYVLDGGAGAQDNYPLTNQVSVSETSGLFGYLIMIAAGLLVSSRIGRRKNWRV